MANKKITVVGDGAEEPLSAEEEHRIEVKIDQMLDPAVPDTPVTSAPTDIQPATAVVAQPAEAPAASAPVPAAVPAPDAPTVTKIVTQFADEPEEASTTPVAQATVPSAEKPKATIKKITIKHHDDEDEADAEDKADKKTEHHAATKAKAAKPKAGTKKSAKKVKVAVAEDAEPADLAAAINQAALAAEEFAEKKPMVEVDHASDPTEPEAPAASEPSASEPAEATPEDRAQTVSETPPEPSEELVDTTEDPDGGAPPLIQKHSVAPIGAPADDTTEPGVDTGEDVQPVVPVSATQPTPSVAISVDEPDEVAETIPVDVEPAAEHAAVNPAEPVSETADDKKYRPPEGPIQFKRAEVPIQPLKPGEPRPEQPIDELSEDEALARAFEAPKPTTKAEKQPKVKRTGSRRKRAAIILVILLLATGGAVAAVPNLRQKAKDLVGLESKTPATPTVTPPNTTKPVTAATTTMSPDIYIAKKDGIYNIYKLTAAGQQSQLVLAGTGNETEKIAMAPNAEGTFAALVSTRDAKRNAAGALQQSVNIVSVADGKPTSVDSADQVKLIDWFGSKIVYVLLNTSTSTSDPNRYQIVSYDTASKSRVVLDHMNYLNEVLAAKGLVYYATVTGPSGPGQFGAIKPDGTEKLSIVGGEIAAITRVSYDEAILSGVNKWYSYHFGEKAATLTNNVSQKSRLYIDSPDGKQSVYVKDGKIVLVDTATSKEKQLAATNATYPIHWLSNDTLVYRSAGADYQLKVAGGQPSKLSDTAEVPGISLWHE